MSAILATAIVLAFIALGEVVSTATRARVPSLLVAMLGLFIAAQVGIVPGDLVDTSTMLVISGITFPAIMVHLGTLIPWATLKKQWRAVLISGVAMITGVLGVLAIVVPVFGLDYAVAGAGPLSGGIVSTMLTTEGLTAAGITSAALVVPSLILMLQSLPAMPATSVMLRRYALSVRDSLADTTLEASAGLVPSKQPGGIVSGHKVEEKTTKRIRIPESLRNNQLFVLFLVLAGATLAHYLGEWTGISYSIWGLLIGIFAAAFGLLPERALDKSNSFGIVIAISIFSIVAPLMTASMSDIWTSLPAVLTTLIVGMVGIMVGGALMTKLVGWDVRVGMSVSLTAMYGFPADYLIVEEVARSTSRSEEERQKLMNLMLPPMLIGGFTTVSAGSIVIASVLIGFL